MLQGVHMKKSKIIKRILGLVIALLPGIMFFYIPTFLQNNTAVSEYYAIHIFPVLSRPFQFVSSLVPVSLTEIVVVFAACSCLLWSILIIYRLIRSEHKKEYIYRFILILSVCFSVTAILFTLFHGINYTREPLESTLSLDASKWSEDDLDQVSVWLVRIMAEIRPTLQEDENGCMVLDTSISRALSDGSAAMDDAAVVFPVLSGSDVLAKPVALLHYWSYIGITGMYFPFLCEANVNIDIPESQLPITICHEISHTRGIAREQDANLAAFLACISSERLDFQYSGYQFALIYCLNDLYSADQADYASVCALIPEGVIRDWSQNSAYWKQFEGPVQETSTEINDSYLQANLQEEGVQSYGRVTDLIIDYYFTYVKGS